MAEVIQTIRPDVLLLNEVDSRPGGESAHRLCAEYLQVSQNGRSPILYPFVFTAPVNTGVPSGQDLDGNGKVSGSGDALRVREVSRPVRHGRAVAVPDRDGVGADLPDVSLEGHAQARSCR